jgi:hypothetical protein
MSGVLRIVLLRTNWSIAFIFFEIIVHSFIMRNYSETWNWVKRLGVVGSWAGNSIL